MTGIVNKVKEALHSNSSSSHSQPEGTHGHHNTRAANAADPRIDSDRDHRANPTTTTTGAHDGSYTTSDNYTYGSSNRGTDGPATRTDGPHNSNLMNKADPRVDSDRDHSRNMGANPSGTATTGAHNTTGTTGTHAGTTGLSSHGTTGTTSTAGPHNSNLMNKADPRVDSDRDGSRNMGMNSTTGAHTGTTGTSGLHSTTGTTGLSSHGTTGTTSTAGPHNSNLMNKADPRVDSDRDGSRNMGMNSTTGTHTGTTGTSGLHSTTGTTGLSSHGTTGTTSTAGPHNSNLMNKADPRVDSDRDGSRNMGMNSTTGTHTGAHTGTTGTTGLGSSTYGAPEGTHGPHSSRAANAADPRVDSDRDHRGATGTAGGKSAVGGFGSSTHGTTTGMTGATGTHAPGPAPNTAGPHKSDMMNKIDPRVDSDMDGSKTNLMINKDPTDAAQVPPSVLQKHIGPPVVEHDDHDHGRSQRHSISHQEKHRGL